jgi:tripartite-type tricarboxylate transporter receptor subunit TctC
MNRAVGRILLAFSAFSASCLLSAGAQAQTAYPDKPLKMLVSWPPGGVTDTIARFASDNLAKSLGQSVVVENRPGANGIVGTQAAAKLPPDGYGLMAVTAETHAINPLVYKNLTYDVLRDFDPVAMLARVSFVLAGKADLESSTVQELITLAKSRPGRFSAASYGIGSTSHVGLASFEKSTGTDFTHVPFQGVVPAVNALLAGQVDVAFVNAFNVEQHRKAGKVKILGAAGARRINTIPDVPTLSEQGVPGFEAGNWYGIVAPRGVPPAIRQRLEAELQKIATSQAFADRARAMGVEVEYRNAAQFGEFLRTESRRWGEVVRDKKIELSQ